MAAASRQPSSSLWVIIQRNPSSGSGAGKRQLMVLSKELRRLGYRVRMFRNRPEMDEWLRDRSSQITIRCLVAAGGDGTVADLSNRHPGIPIAVLPMGTENLLARYLGLRRDGLQLAGVIHQNVVRVLDSALANGRRFLLMLSSGVDADVVAALHGKRTGNISRLNYLIPTVRAFFGSRVREFEVCSDDQANRLRGTHVIVTNIPRYGFQLEFSPGADPSDGLLDVRVCHCKTRWGIVWHAIRLKLGLPISSSEFSTFRAASVRMIATSGGSDRSQCDGDPGPDLPLRVQIERGTLQLLVPSN